MVDEFTDGYDPNIGDEFRANDVPIWPLGAKTITVSQSGSDTVTEAFGQLPENAVVLGVVAEVVTAFTAGTTVGDLVVGTSSTADKFAAAGEIDEETVGVSLVGNGSGMSKEGSDQTLQAQFQPGTGDNSVGEARVTVLYMAVNEN